MAERDARIDRLLLGQEIADFLYREAELLDERRYREWLDLLADDIRYWMPMRRNVKFGEDERELFSALYTCYAEWCESSKVRPVESKIGFGRRIDDRFTREETAGRKQLVHGIAIRPPQQHRKWRRKE